MIVFQKLSWNNFDEIDEKVFFVVLLPALNMTARSRECIWLEGVKLSLSRGQWWFNMDARFNEPNL